METLDDVVAQTALAEVGHTDGRPFGTFAKGLYEEVARPVVDHEHRLSGTLRSLLFVAQFPFLHGNAIFPRQPSQCLDVGELFVLHEKFHRVATFPAAEAFADLFGRRHHERRSLFVVERAKTFEVGAGLAEADEFAHNLYDVGCGSDAGYCVNVYHVMAWKTGCVGFRNFRKITILS